MSVDSMVILPSTKDLVVEDLPAPAGFVFNKCTLPDGKFFAVIDPESRKNLVEETPISLDNADYFDVTPGTLPIAPVPGLIFQYVTAGAVDVHRLPSEALNHGNITYQAGVGYHTEVGGINVQYLPGFKTYTAVGEFKYSCVTMDDYYECHVQNDMTGVGEFFELDTGVWLRVVT